MTVTRPPFLYITRLRRPQARRGRARHERRFHRRNPDMSKVFLNNGLAMAGSGRGLAPRALRNIQAGVRAGRFTVRDPELAITVIAGRLAERSSIQLRRASPGGQLPRHDLLEFVIELDQQRVRSNARQAPHEGIGLARPLHLHGI